MKHLLLLLISCSLLGSFSQAQEKDSLFKKLDRLCGNWKAVGGGQPGQGSGSFSFTYDLDKKILVRRSRSEYPASANKPSLVHEDFMIVYSEAGPLKAIYFDNEGHTIHYTISFPDDTVEFLSDAPGNGPRFKLTYAFAGKDEVMIDFAIASPQDPDRFTSYVKGTAQRTE